MAQIWEHKEPTILREWIDALYDEASTELNVWEEAFIEDMDDRLKIGSILTEGQENKLEEIYSKYTS